MSSGPESRHGRRFACELIGTGRSRGCGERPGEAASRMPGGRDTAQDLLRGVPVDRAKSVGAHLTSFGVDALVFVTHPKPPTSPGSLRPRGLRRARSAEDS
jgi:hypothetical protein